MIDFDHTLTLMETEELCRLYMDCRLTVLEETELRYLLAQSDLRSELIDETKELMGVEAVVAEAFSVSGTPPDRDAPEDYRQISPVVASRGLSRFARYWWGAASVAVLAAAALFLYRHEAQCAFGSSNCCVAYANGNRLGKQEALRQAEEAMDRADAFIREMEELEVQELNRLKNFTLVTTSVE